MRRAYSKYAGAGGLSGVEEGIYDLKVVEFLAVLNIFSIEILH
jgi:hypothetical protein